MTFSDKTRYDKIFQQVTHKGGESKLNYIKIFHNAQNFSFSVGNNYSKDKLMHTLLDNFKQGKKYSSQIASHQAELINEEKITDQKVLSVSSLQTEYLNLDSSSGCGKNSERANIFQKKCTFYGGANHYAYLFFKSIRKEKEKVCASIYLDNKCLERTPCKFFRCGYEDNMIAKVSKPPKDNKKQRKQIYCSEIGKHASQKKMRQSRKYKRQKYICIYGTYV